MAGWGNCWKSSCSNPAILLVFLLIVHQTFLTTVTEILAVTSILTMNYIARDLDRVFRKDVLTDELYELFAAQKFIRKQFNAAFGLVVSIYSAYCVPYYGLHFVDMLSRPEEVANIFLVVTSTTTLCYACKLVVDVDLLV